MKTPTWALVVGIMMLLFGSCSLNGDLQSIYSPKMFEIQEKILDGMSDGMKDAQSDSTKTNKEDATETTSNLDDKIMFEKMSENMKDMFHVSDFTKTWMVRFGYIGIIVSIIYILGGLFLLIKKPFSIKLVYVALGLSIIFSIVKVIVLSADSSDSFITMTAGFSEMFGVVFDIILLIVILTSNREVYKSA